MPFLDSFQEAVSRQQSVISLVRKATSPRPMVAASNNRRLAAGD
jgi:hypothetical protein